MSHIPLAIVFGIFLNLALAVFGFDLSRLPRGIFVLRDNLLIVFFICVGLSLSLGVLKPVARPVLRVLGAAVVLIVTQNIGGMAVARLFSAPLGSGVLLGSVSFVGGFGSAVAWGGVLEGLGMPQATSIGVAGAVLGTVLGAVVAGPFGAFLGRGGGVDDSGIPPSEVGKRNFKTSRQDLASFISRLRVFLSASSAAWLVFVSSFASAYLLGEVFQIAVGYLPIMLPRFLTAMLGAVLVVGILPERIRLVGRSLTTTLEVFALNIFLLITFITLDFGALVGIGAQALATAAFQVLITVFVAWSMVFLPISRDRASGRTASEQRAEAAATAAAVVGFGLSSLSVAMAVLSEMDDDSGRSRQTIAVTGAGLVDTLNAVGIGVCFWLVGVVS